MRIIFVWFEKMHQLQTCHAAKAIFKAAVMQNESLTIQLIHNVLSTKWIDWWQSDSFWIRFVSFVHQSIESRISISQQNWFLLSWPRSATMNTSLVRFRENEKCSSLWFRTPCKYSKHHILATVDFVRLNLMHPQQRIFPIYKPHLILITIRLICMQPNMIQLQYIPICTEKAKIWSECFLILSKIYCVRVKRTTCYLHGITIWYELLLYIYIYKLYCKENWLFRLNQTMNSWKM